MTRWITLGLVGLGLLAAGCSSERDKNMNRDHDRPRSADLKKDEPAKPKK
jgi:hypothetical protein